MSDACELCGNERTNLCLNCDPHLSNDELAALRAENARLREALEPILEMATDYAKHHGLEDSYYKGTLDRASTALEHKP